MYVRAECCGVAEYEVYTLSVPVGVRAATASVCIYSSVWMYNKRGRLAAGLAHCHMPVILRAEDQPLTGEAVDGDRHRRADGPEQSRHVRTASAACGTAQPNAAAACILKINNNILVTCFTDFPGILLSVRSHRISSLCGTSQPPAAACNTVSSRTLRIRVENLTPIFSRSVLYSYRMVSTLRV